MPNLSSILLLLFLVCVWYCDIYFYFKKRLISIYQNDKKIIKYLKKYKHTLKKIKKHPRTKNIKL
jgi:hypothetical protein